MRIQLTNYQYRNLQEALGDDIPDYMKDIIQKRYKGDYLTKDVPQHTDKIPNVKMEVKNDEIVDYASNQLVKSMTDKLVEQMKKSEIWQEYDRFPSYLPGPLRVMMNASIPNMDRTKEDPLNIQILQKYTWFYSKEFRLPDSRLNDDSTLKSEEKDAWGKMIKSDNIKWSNNKTGISSFLTTIKRVFPETFGYLDVDKIIRDKHFVGLREPIINYQQNVKKIGEYPLYLYITDKPDDKLRMSVSQFYDSCQNIYTGGEQGTEYNKKLLSNVFDKNSKVAYLIYNKPYKDTRGNEHPFTSIARCILRVNKDGGVMFDKVYPTNLERIFYSIITENTGIENVGETEDVYDYEGVDGLPAPYMDKYKLRTSGLNQREKINALSKRLKIDPSTITAKDDETFEVVDRTERGTKYKLERWKVVPVEDALERASDSMRVNFLDIFGNYSVEEVINGIIDGWELLQVLDLEEEYYSYFNSAHQDGEDTTIYEFLSEVYNVNDVYDIDEILTKNKINSVEWFSGNIDMDEIIERYDGEGHFIGSTLNWNHDEAYVGIDYVYYREYYEW
jgi:hypothetical protein